MKKSEVNKVNIFGGKKMKKFFILFLLLGITSSALAAGTTDWWDGVTPPPGTTYRDRDWFNPNNWVWSDNTLPAPGVPTATSEVKMHRTAAAPYDLTCIIAGGAAVASVINIGGVGANAEPYGRLTIDSGSLTVGNGLRIGGSSSSRRSGQLFVNGGIINAPAYLAVGYGPNTGTSNVSGWLYMIGGTINVGQFDFSRIAGTNGYADISGGTINATDLRMKPVGGSGIVLLNLSGSGKIIIDGDKTAAITQYMDDGWINGEVQYDYNISNPGKTTLFIPEPATLCLLGIGALSLLRRRK